MEGRPSFKIRLMLPSDLEQAVNLSVNEGWNQTLADWSFLLNNPGNICTVAEHKGRVTGTATATVYGKRLAWIGMVIVDKPMRGLGAGKMLLEDMTGRLNHIDSVKLDATPAGEPLYTKLGFIPEYRILRMTREPAIHFVEYDPAIKAEKLSPGIFSEIIRTDREIFGADRGSLLQYLLDSSPDKAFLTRSRNIPEGYVFGREGIRFGYIGPLNALSGHSVIPLVSRALEIFNGRAVAIDVPEDKKQLAEWLESAGFLSQRLFTRMYLHHNPHSGIPENQYLIAGPEFG